MNAQAILDHSPRTEAEIPAAVQGCLVACRRCADVARALTAEQYSRKPSGRHSIGEHMRHCVDHFDLLFRGIDAGVVDYDARERDAELEREPAKFLEAMTEIMDRLGSIDEASLHATVAVRTLAAPGREPVIVRSTLGRELSFLSSHNIHHIAIMGMLAEAMGIELPEDFGVAYSTAAYRTAAGR